jgi:hypothetical protein
MISRPLVLWRKDESKMQTAYQPRPEDVERKLAAAFPSAAERRAARELLEQYSSDHGDRDSERVQLAALFLSNGDLARLQTELTSALVDYRDTLAAAEYPSFTQLPVDIDKTSDVYLAAIKRDRERYLAWIESKE